MAKAAKKIRAIKGKPHEVPVGIKGEFLDVFKVVKQHKENNAKKKP